MENGRPGREIEIKRNIYSQRVTEKKMRERGKIQTDRKREIEKSIKLPLAPFQQKD